VKRREGAQARGDTIVAIATPPGTGAIGVVRISGSAAVAAASTLVRLAHAHALETASPRVLHHAVVIDPATGEELDVVLVVRMPGPHSYTGEDVVEISCHGNPVLLSEIVRRLLIGGARLAEPGEFTQRAYLNGRLDLLQAEAVAALIGARTERAVRLAARQLRGPLSEEITMLRERLLDLVAGLEVALDFPEEDVGLTRTAAVKQAQDLGARLTRLLERSGRGRAVQDGLGVMLTGAPNVGKSSLLNALLGAERAIVSPSPGTTRDLIEASVVMGGVPVRIVDGAGLATPNDPVDAEGMRRAKRALLESDLVIVVLDRSRARSSDDVAIMDLTSGRERIVVANKGDLAPAWCETDLCEVVCSALTGTGIDMLQRRLEQWVDDRTREDADEGGVVVSLRVHGQVEAARSALGQAIDALADAPIEAVLVDLRDASVALAQTLGIDTDDDILSRIFAGFCVGK
jgi:tRNA modification GTPase